MDNIKYQEYLNWEDIYSQLNQRAIYLFLIGGLGGMWLLLPGSIFQWKNYLFVFAIFLLGLAMLVFRQHVKLTRLIFVFGVNIFFFSVMWFYDSEWIPLLVPLLLIINAIWLPGIEWFSAVTVIGFASWMASEGFRTYSIPVIIGVVVFSLAIARISLGAFFTTIGWVVSLQNQTNKMLEQTRDNQAELSRTLKSLELVNNIQTRIQHDLVLAKKQAEEAGRAKQQFAANMSHELRTPLSLILGFTEIMYLNPEIYGEIEMPPHLRRDIYQVYINSQHLLQMIDDVLSISKFDLAEFSIRVEKIKTTQFLLNTSETIKILFKRSSSNFESDIPHNLPEIEFDSTRIRQVIFNLINNAKRFSELNSNGIVKLSARREENALTISISDNGPGIPKENIDLVFAPFYQDDSLLRKEHGGAGLGLAISKRFVEAQGGKIWVESTVGQVTKFFFTIPIKPSFQVPFQEINWEKNRSLHEAKPCIFLLGGDAAISSLFQRRFSTFEIIDVNDKDNIEEKFNIFHPRAIINNINPERKDLHHFQISRPIPVIECSLPSVQWLAESPQIVSFLSKPISPSLLVNEISGLKDIKDLMIIDDDLGFIQFITRVMEVNKLQYHIHYAVDGNRGLSIMKENRPDLLILDMILPEFSGADVLEAMGKDQDLSQIPIIILSADKPSITLNSVENKLVISRSDGFNPSEILLCIESVMNLLETHLDVQESRV